MAVLSSPKVMDDLVKWEADARFCRASGTIENAVGGTTVEITDPVGQPVVSDGAGGYGLAEVGEEANVVGLIMQGPTIEAIANAERSENEYLILVRGPALINEAAINLDDPDGTGTFTLATILTALEALDIRVLEEHPEIEIQTT